MDKLILERAQSALLSRDFVLAARLYKTLLKEESDNVDILRALGGLYEKSNEDEKAIPYYENILTFDPHDVDAMNSLGGIYRRLKQHEKAIEILNRALDESKKSAMINYTLGFTYKDMGNYDDAIDCFESVVSENPSDVLAYNHLGVIHTAQKNYDKAVMAFRRGLQIDPNHPILHYNLAHAYEAKKSYAEAIKCYELALKAKPGWVDAINDFAKLLLACQKIRRAYDVIQKSVQLYPSNPDLISMLGKVCIKRFDFDAAEEAYEKADRLKADNPKIMIGKAECYERNSKIEDAIITAKQAQEIGLPDASSKKRFVHIMLSGLELKRAYDEINTMHLENPSDTGVLDLKAQYMICAGNEDASVEIFNQIAELNSNYAHHYLEAARRYCHLGKYDKAIELANQYIEKRPSNPAVYNLLGKIYELKGEYENALEEIKKGCSLNVENVYGKKEINRLVEAYNTSLQSEVVDYINDFNEQQHEAEKDALSREDAAPIPENVEEEVIEEQEEKFDFEQMGGDLPTEESEEDEADAEDTTSVPLLAELSEDEGLNAFDEILNDTDEILEPEKQEEKKEELEFDPEEKSNPYERFVSDPVSSQPQSAVVPPAPVSPPQSQIDSRIADKLDDAVRQMERTVDSVAKMAEERAQEAIQKAEDAVRKVEEAVAKIPESASSSEPSVSPSVAASPQASASIPRPVDNLDDMFSSEPSFDSFDDFKDPFGEPLPIISPSEPKFEEPMPASVPSTLMNQSHSLETPHSAASEAFASAAEFLPNIVKMLENKNIADKYKSELGLFQKLRSLSNHLPPQQKDKFLTSKTRMLMDYVIAKMSGSPGLMTTVKNLLNSGILDPAIDYSSIEKEAENISGDELVCKVIKDLKALTNGLEDKQLARALNDEADKILSRM